MYWVYVCVFCTLSSVQSVNMYCPYVNCCFFFCTLWSTLIRISLTKALVLWWCDSKSDLIWFENKSIESCKHYAVIYGDAGQLDTPACAGERCDITSIALHRNHPSDSITHPDEPLPWQQSASFMWRAVDALEEAWVALHIIRANGASHYSHCNYCHLVSLRGNVEGLGLN